jgi:hypothetical protein
MLKSLDNYIHKRQYARIVDSDHLPSETFRGNFCVLRHPPYPHPLFATEYTFVCYKMAN